MLILPRDEVAQKKTDCDLSDKGSINGRDVPQALASIPALGTGYHPLFYPVGAGFITLGVKHGRF